MTVFSTVFYTSAREIPSLLYTILYNELCKTRILIGLEECVIRV